MYVLLVEYKKPMEEVLKFLDAHRTYLSKFYASGNLLISGRQNPPVGGLILADFTTREDLDAFIHADPFYTEKIGEYHVHEFTPAQHCSELAKFVK